MLCERCDKHEATFHLTEIINNGKTEFHLCERCAKQFKINNGITKDIMFPLDEMIYLLDRKDLKAADSKKVCVFCGMAESEYEERDKVGCPCCYIYFKKASEKALGSINNKELYSDKLPLRYIEVKYREAGQTDIEYSISDIKQNKTFENLKIEALNEELQSAVAQERYEEAAIIRDLIKGVK